MIAHIHDHEAQLLAGYILVCSGNLIYMVNSWTPCKVVCNMRFKDKHSLIRYKSSSKQLSAVSTLRTNHSYELYVVYKPTVEDQAVEEIF